MPHEAQTREHEPVLCIRRRTLERVTRQVGRIHGTDGAADWLASKRARFDGSTPAEYLARAVESYQFKHVLDAADDYAGPDRDDEEEAILREIAGIKREMSKLRSPRGPKPPMRPDGLRRVRIDQDD